MMAGSRNIMMRVPVTCLQWQRRFKPFDLNTMLTSDPADWVSNPNYPADPRPFQPPPRPFDPTILHGLINGGGLTHRKRRR